MRRREDLAQPRRSRRLDLGIHYDPDAFGDFSETIARTFGTARFLVIQTVVVAIWIGLNITAWGLQWDPYPFILLNLAFSTQAAYAAPLILLAQTRQADRDKHIEERAEQHHEEQVRYAQERVAAIKTETDKLTGLLKSNTQLTREDKELTEQVAALTREIHAQVISAKG